MASEPVRSTAIHAAPKDYSIPAAQQLRLLSVRASFTDNGAASDWLPALEILDNNGNELVTAADQGVKVTAGSDADVSWFPGGLKGGGGTSTTGASASAYLWTQTPHTFTGTSGFSATWVHFQTTDTTVFGTNPFNSGATTPTHNQTGDVNLVLLKDGAYVVEATSLWANGTTNFYGEIQLGTIQYVDDGHPTAIGDLPTDVPGMSIEGRLMTQSVRCFTIPSGDSPNFIYLLLEGQTASNYTVDQWSMVCHWLGPGIGSDHVVY